MGEPWDAYRVRVGEKNVAFPQVSMLSLNMESECGLSMWRLNVESECGVSIWKL